MLKCIHKLNKSTNNRKNRQNIEKPTDNPHPSPSGAAPLAQLLIISAALPTMMLIMLPTTRTA